MLIRFQGLLLKRNKMRNINFYQAFWCIYGEDPKIYGEGPKHTMPNTKELKDIVDFLRHTFNENSIAYTTVLHFVYEKEYEINNL